MLFEAIRTHLLCNTFLPCRTFELFPAMESRMLQGLLECDKLACPHYCGIKTVRSTSQEQAYLFQSCCVILLVTHTQRALQIGHTIRDKVQTMSLFSHSCPGSSDLAKGLILGCQDDCLGVEGSACKLQFQHYSEFPTRK